VHLPINPFNTRKLLDLLRQKSKLYTAYKHLIVGALSILARWESVLSRPVACKPGITYFSMRVLTVLGTLADDRKHHSPGTGRSHSLPNGPIPCGTRAISRAPLGKRYESPASKWSRRVVTQVPSNNSRDVEAVAVGC
jgi:hypothetical protein